MGTSSLARDVTALRISLAHATRCGLGMTLASCVYWAELAGVVAWAGLAEHAFALAALLGAHFLPYGWLYRSPSYYALGIGTVLVAAAVQLWLPRAANAAIPPAMLACYTLASLGVWRENRASGMHAC